MGRMDKINSQVKREVSSIIQRELGDPRLTFVTITKAEVSPDLKNAKIFYSVLGDDKQQKASTAALKNAANMIRKYLAKTMQTRNTPTLVFDFDQTIKDSIRLEEMLREIHDAENPTDNSGI